MPQRLELRLTQQNRKGKLLVDLPFLSAYKSIFCCAGGPGRQHFPYVIDMVAFHLDITGTYVAAF